MNGLLIYNSANDVVFQQFNKELIRKIGDIAKSQKLLTDKNDSLSTKLDGNVILQIFSPVITSQRIMLGQFDNTYASFECDNDVRFVFGEFLGYTFIKIGEDTVEKLKQCLDNAISFSQYLYGPNLFNTQADNSQQRLLANCLHSYEYQLWNEEQAMIMEALPCLLINADIKRSVTCFLDSALECLQLYGYQRAHALMFVSHKFVGISSSKQAHSICASDIMFMSLLRSSIQREEKQLNRSMMVFLQGISGNNHSGCIPCIAHMTSFHKNILLVQIIEFADLQIANSLYDTFFGLQKMVSVQVQAEPNVLKTTFENLDGNVRQTLDALKRIKLKSNDIEIVLKKFSLKWETLRKLYIDLLKSYENELIVRIESNIPSFGEELKQLFTLTCCDSSSVSLDKLPTVAAMVEGKILEFSEFLAVKAERNISIVAYLEDFPGLIHFLFVNRSSGLMIAPDICGTKHFNKKCLLDMMKRVRTYLRKGQSTIMWKDKTFNYSYFLWFEDKSLGVSKLVNIQEISLLNDVSYFKNYETENLTKEFYQQIYGNGSFLNNTSNKLKCYELFCIHLGIVNSACAIEHSRRLKATIADCIGQDYF